jgi:uncharacterized protein (TIGR04222 family)
MTALGDFSNVEAYRCDAGFAAVAARRDFKVAGRRTSLVLVSAREPRSSLLRQALNEVLVNPDQAALWERIEAFDLDEGRAPEMTFIRRLARENAWELGYATRAVSEYRRYIFLAITVGRAVCPSEQVDQVWHQHLTYTRSYWRFCADVLKTTLHHEPTRGGKEEGLKHWDMYVDTLRAYQAVFGHPPSDLWPPPERRFGEDLWVRKVNTQHYWLLPKPRFEGSILSSTAVAITVLAAVFLITSFTRRFSLDGIEYLPFFFLIWSAVVGFGLVLRWACTAPDLKPEVAVPQLDPYEFAFLKGGRARVVEAVLVNLIAKRHAEVATTGEVVIHDPLPADAGLIKTAVFAALIEQSAQKLRLAPLKDAVKQIETTHFARLREMGLLPSQAASKAGIILPVLLSLGVILLLGATRLSTATANHRPAGFLALLMLATTAVSLIAFARPIRRTRKADAIIQAQESTLLGARPWYPAVAVAVFGLTVLKGTAYASIYNQLHNSDSGGCGGGGCGGGGCGGCGGCGG